MSSGSAGVRRISYMYLHLMHGALLQFHRYIYRETLFFKVPISIVFFLFLVGGGGGGEDNGSVWKGVVLY